MIRFKLMMSAIVSNIVKKILKKIKIVQNVHFGRFINLCISTKWGSVSKDKKIKIG